jgi:glyoxylase-like metal-dependent hydrolase (beta-lactamase superfamily II)
MTELNRRTLLAGTAAAGAAAATGALNTTPALAAAPAAGKQNSGWYRYKVGDAEVTVVTDGVNRVGKLPDNFVLNKSMDEVNKALAEDFRAPGQLEIPYNPVVVNNGGKLILIDTGTGEAGFNSSKGVAGQFASNLLASGYKPEQIDAVVITHYHGDHINGLLKADNTIAFPNAEILVPSAEHKFWMDDGEMSRAQPGRMEGLFKNNRRVFNPEVLKRVKTYDPGKEVTPGLTAMATYGHSAGHNSLMLSSGGKTVFMSADVTNVPFLFLRNPGWHLTFDQDPKMAEETRKKVYDMVSKDKIMVQGFHFPFPAMAYVEKTANGYREIAVPWMPVL